MAKKPTIHIARSAVTGRIVKPAYAASHPRTTVIETRPAPKHPGKKK